MLDRFESTRTLYFFIGMTVSFFAPLCNDAQFFHKIGYLIFKHTSPYVNHGFVRELKHLSNHWEEQIQSFARVMAAMT